MRHDSRFHLSNTESFNSSRALRKSTGTFYTPKPLSKKIAQEAIFAWLSNRAGVVISNPGELIKLEESKRRELLKSIKEIKILDPAVGEGIFLLSSAEWLSKIRIALDGEVSEKIQRTEIVQNCLFGVDLARDAVKSCVERLREWGSLSTKYALNNFKIGNSLVGLTKSISYQKSTHEELNHTILKIMNSKKTDLELDELLETNPIHWHIEFPNIFSKTSSGFDIILGNPPYGNILGPIERRHISNTYAYSVGGGRYGTWNSAAHFLVRAISLLKDSGQLGFLVPNSILRVKQFSKTRDFLLKNTKLWKIVDEGSPFDDVTLEMISLFCESTRTKGDHRIYVESRRQGFEQSNIVSSRVLKDSRVFSIYHDYILAKIHERGQKHLLVAGRGRDIPKEHVSRKQTSKFKTPYITSGRSVQRYKIQKHHLLFTDDWFKEDSDMLESYENEFLVATKNYRYPRCIIKPRKMIHGGGIVKITPLYDKADLKVLGLILNSKFVRQISIRYFTNYSQLTCCLNTGIMEEIPLVLPKHSEVYRNLFEILSQLYTSKENHANRIVIITLERLADALIYSLYFGNSELEERVVEGIDNLYETSQQLDVIRMINEILGNTYVTELERLGNFPASRKIRRY